MSVQKFDEARGFFSIVVDMPFPPLYNASNKGGEVMSPKNSFWKDLEELLEAIGKAIATFVTWVYQNILWLIVATMLVNVVIFFGLDGDVTKQVVLLRIWALWNTIILICLVVWFWQKRYYLIHHI
jgi:hypothetical protein